MVEEDHQDPMVVAMDQVVMEAAVEVVATTVGRRPNLSQSPQGRQIGSKIRDLGIGR